MKKAMFHNEVTCELLNESNQIRSRLRMIHYLLGSLYNDSSYYCNDDDDDDEVTKMMKINRLKKIELICYSTSKRN